jgi:uncharacterized OB-fold protein
MPARDFCPHCLSGETSFVETSGRAKLISWVVYQKAFHEAFANRVPYNVALVELEEGPRMITNVLCSKDELVADMSLVLQIQHEDELAVARFAPASSGDNA